MRVSTETLDDSMRLLPAAAGLPVAINAANAAIAVQGTMDPLAGATAEPKRKRFLKENNALTTTQQSDPAYLFIGPFYHARSAAPLPITVL